MLSCMIRVVVKIFPFWGTLNIRCRIIIGIQKGVIFTSRKRSIGIGRASYSQTRLRVQGLGFRARV